MPKPSAFEPDEPIGIRLIASTPQARPRSITPAPTSDDTRLVACWLEPHCVSTVVAAVDIGRPAASHAVRDTLNACSPTWLTQPPTTWPTSVGSMPVRSTIARWTIESTSAGCMVDRPPPRLPMGVRTASTMTTFELEEAEFDMTPTVERAGRSGSARESIGCYACTDAFATEHLRSLLTGQRRARRPRRSAPVHPRDRCDGVRRRPDRRRILGSARGRRGGRKRAVGRRRAARRGGSLVWLRARSVLVLRSGDGGRLV